MCRGPLPVPCPTVAGRRGASGGAPEHRDDDGRLDQRAEGLGQRHHVEERLGDQRAGGRGEHEAVDVAAQEFVREARLLADRVGVEDVGAGGQVPGGGDRPRHGALRTPGQPGRGDPVLGHELPQRHGTLRGHREPVPVDRVVRGDRVTDRDETLGPVLDLLEQVAAVHGAAGDEDVRQGLRVGDELAHDRMPDPAGERLELLGGAGGLTAPRARKGHQPAAALDRHDGRRLPGDRLPRVRLHVHQG